MRYILLFSFLLITFSSVAQRAFEGKIVDRDKKGIPYAMVQIKGTYEGTYCDEQGNFSIEVKDKQSSILLFFCMGYETAEVAMAPTSGKGLVVELKEKVTELAEVDITAKRGRNSSKVKILGKSKLKCEGQAYMNIGTEYGLHLKTGAAAGGYIEEVMVYITDIGIPDSRFRIHVYQADGRSELAKKEITGGNIIAHAGKGNEWVRINVSDKHIRIPQDIIISMEWISGYGNSPEVRSKGVMKYQGQVMGLTTDYGQKSKYVKFLFQDRQASNPEWLVPMIYCTYRK